MITDKRQTARNRAITLSRIKEQLQLFYKEDLEELQQAIADTMLAARPRPAEDKLVAPGEWLEERVVTPKTPAGKARHYVYLRWIDDAGKERGSLVFHGTLAAYKAQPLADS